MNVPQHVIDAGIASFAGGVYRLPDGAVTPVHPSAWAWQCSPGIGSEASCVGVPEPSHISPPSGILPAPIAAPSRVVTEALRFEETDRYQTWSSCHPVGLTPDQFIGQGCAAAVAAATGGTGNAMPLPSVMNAFGCLIAAIAVLGAVSDVFGGKR